MIEPKVFYRKLDFLLDKIGREKTGKDFLFTIADELVNTFEKDLHISHGRIFEECEEEYLLITPEGESFTDVPSSLRLNSKAVQAILKNKTYIFDNTDLTIEVTPLKQGEYVIPAALTVHSPEYRWIFIFQLKSGWIREEIELCLNAVRTVLTYRLLSDAIRSEKQQAANIQQSLLPASSPNIDGYEIAGLSIPAEIVGGDLFDYFDFGKGSFGVCIGDASGHGLPAALLVRDVVTGLRMGFEEDNNFTSKFSKINKAKFKKKNENKMVHTLKKLNHVIFRSTYSTRFVSLFTASFDATGNFYFVNAGHPAPIMVSPEKVTELEPTGLIFGALPEIELSSAKGFMTEGSVMVLFSDGIIERMDTNNQEFSLFALRELIVMERNKRAQEILDTIFSVVLEYGKSSRWEDDATVIVIKRTGCPKLK